jgi:hypothetical protein
MQKYVFISIILMLSSCHFFNQLSFDENLTSKVNLQYSKENEPVDLIKITDFEWDNYIIISSYQIPDKVGEKYNIDLSNISKYATSDDSKFLLVFIKNKKAIKICKVKSNTEFTKTNILKIKKNNKE